MKCQFFPVQEFACRIARALSGSWGKGTVLKRRVFCPRFGGLVFAGNETLSGHKRGLRTSAGETDRPQLHGNFCNMRSCGARHEMRRYQNLSQV